MNTALLFVAAACLADTIEPPLADSGPPAKVKAIPAPLPVPPLQPVPSPTQVSTPGVQAAPTTMTNRDEAAPRLVPVPAQMEEPKKPKRFGFLRGLFRRKSSGANGNPAGMGYYPAGEVVGYSPPGNTQP
jgi:hypothetical protein